MLALAVVGYFYTGANSNQTTLSLGDRDFAISDISSVRKIFLLHRNGASTTLEKKDHHWLYNGKWKANPNAVSNLLEAVGSIEIKYQPAQAAIPNIVKDLATQGIKVELYDAEDNLLKTYYVGGGTADERGTYIILENSEQPYVGHLPNWEGNLRFRYNLTGYDWRDKTLFSYSADSIQSVSVEYPKQRNVSFTLTKKSSGFEVVPFYESTSPKSSLAVPSKIEAYLTGFKSVGAEAFEYDHPNKDSISGLVPFSIITLTTVQGNTQRVNLYPIYPPRIYNFNDPKSPNLPASQVERFFGLTHDNELMLLQNRVFQKLLWSYDGFF